MVWLLVTVLSKFTKKFKINVKVLDYPFPNFLNSPNRKSLRSKAIPRWSRRHTLDPVLTLFWFLENPSHCNLEICIWIKPGKIINGIGSLHTWLEKLVELKFAFNNGKLLTQN